ncbi:hypothetical protein, partial, partial [Absidia glauca]
KQSDIAWPKSSHLYVEIPPKRRPIPATRLPGAERQKFGWATAKGGNFYEQSGATNWLERISSRPFNIKAYRHLELAETNEDGTISKSVMRAGVFYGNTCVMSDVPEP